MKKSRQILLYLTEEQDRLLQAKADNIGMKKPEYIRFVLFRQPLEEKIDAIYRAVIK